MRWCVIRHPELDQPGVIPETSLELYGHRGWQRVSEWTTDQTTLQPADYADAAPVADEPAESAESAPAKPATKKEK